MPVFNLKFLHYFSLSEKIIYLTLVNLGLFFGLISIIIFSISIKAKEAVGVSDFIPSTLALICAALAEKMRLRALKRVPPAEQKGNSDYQTVLPESEKVDFLSFTNSKLFLSITGIVISILLGVSYLLTIPTYKARLYEFFVNYSEIQK